MKEYKIDLSMYEGKVREVVSEAIQEKAFLLGYVWCGANSKSAIHKDSAHLFTDKYGDLTMILEKDVKYFNNKENPEISAADFLALTQESVKDAPEFMPFDRVLVRDDDDYKWGIDWFESFSEDSPYSFQCFGSCWKQCIPYEGNEHLLGTTEDV